MPRLAADQPGASSWLIVSGPRLPSLTSDPRLPRVDSLAIELTDCTIARLLARESRHPEVLPIVIISWPDRQDLRLAAAAGCEPVCGQRARRQLVRCGGGGWREPKGTSRGCWRGPVVSQRHLLGSPAPAGPLVWAAAAGRAAERVALAGGRVVVSGGGRKGGRRGYPSFHSRLTRRGRPTPALFCVGRGCVLPLSRHPHMGQCAGGPLPGAREWHGCLLVRRSTRLPPPPTRPSPVAWGQVLPTAVCCPSRHPIHPIHPTCWPLRTLPSPPLIRAASTS